MLPPVGGVPSRLLTGAAAGCSQLGCLLEIVCMIALSLVDLCGGAGHVIFSEVFNAPPMYVD